MRLQSTFFALTVSLIVVMTAWLNPAQAADRSPKGSRSVQGTTGTPVRTYLNINNISTVYSAFGIADIDIQEANSGLVYPKGSRKTAMFESGLLWGGIVNGQVRVGGSAYRTGLQTGKILPTGVAESPTLPKNRIYRVRPDYRTGSLSAEAADEGRSESEIKAQYEKDWNEWPATDGAPFLDKDSNGVYDPGTDIPGVPGADQTIWYVANDLNSSLTNQLYGSSPMGLELQVTVWAYAQQGALGNMFFKRFVLINKGANRIDSMYISQWADPDLGDSNDDYAGCDTSLSLGYVYNANASDATYAPLPPPATGFDFFQGPVVPGAPTDSAIIFGKRIGGKKNLPMTAFYYFARGDPAVTDPTQGSYEGTIQFYNFFRGRIGKTGQLFTDPGGRQTTFALAGDPVRGTGWVDGDLLPAGDRRIGLASGPFTMAAGDTQEVVVAEMCAGANPGGDRLSAISLLKFYDQTAQETYNNFFNPPAAPAAPHVSAVELNRTILLEWGSDTASVRATEKTYNNEKFSFWGYNIYQLPSASAGRDQAKLVESIYLDTDSVLIGGSVKPAVVLYDSIPDPTGSTFVPEQKQLGTKVGPQRTYEIRTDATRGGTPLINGRRYYFAVTAVGYRPVTTKGLNSLESPLALIKGADGLPGIVPHGPAPGFRAAANATDTLSNVTHTSTAITPSEGQVIPIVIDPAKLKDHLYKVTFDTLRLDPAAAEPTVVWNLIDSTSNTTLISHNSNLTGNEDYPIVDGMMVKVTGPPTLGMKDWDIPAGTRRWTWAGADGFALEGFSGAMGNAYDNWFSSSTVLPSTLHNVLFKFTDTDSTGKIVNPADTLASFAYRYLRRADTTAYPPDSTNPAFRPYIINPGGGYAFQDYVKGMPFAAYDAETGQRLAVGFLENNVKAGKVDGRYDPPSNNDLIANTAGDGAREFFFIFATPYTGATPDTSLTKDILNETLPMSYMGTPNMRGTNTFHSGDEFLILAQHPNTVNDVFRFTAPPVTYSAATAKQDVQSINVFPNPYYAVNQDEINKYQRFVTFTHLPTKATIRIFNLAGVLVRTITKNDATTQQQRWDLANEAGLPASSGLYIAHIEMGDLGTKIVKFTVVQERQILDRF